MTEALPRLSEAEIEKLEALLEQATPGPWRVANFGDGDIAVLGEEHVMGHIGGMVNSIATADFIAALHNAAPALLEAVKERDRLRERDGLLSVIERSWPWVIESAQKLVDTCEAERRAASEEEA